MYKALSRRSFATAAVDYPIPVVQAVRDNYSQTAKNIWVKENAPVMILGTGKASQYHNAVAQKFGTNIVGAMAPGKEGATFLDRPVYGDVKRAVRELKPQVASVFVPLHAATASILECIEAEIPLIVSVAEGIPAQDQLKLQAALRSQSKSRLLGANCPGMIIPGARVKLGIQPLNVHSPGRIGLASRSGTISYELANHTSMLGYGQSIVFGLGGDPFPGTRTWEALDLLLKDDKTDVICLVGEVGGQMEEEAASLYKEYLAKLPAGQRPKPVVGFIAGRTASQSVLHGHAGAIWYDQAESAESKIKCWEDAGFVMARTIGDIGDVIKTEVERL